MARGDHIKVRRLGFLYAHHGIDMGDGTVIHFSGEPLFPSRARVIRSDFAAFCQGGTSHVVPYPNPVRTPEAVVATAEGLLSAGAYCVLLNNCEHFATYCKTGKTTSYQVRRVALAVGATHTTVAVTVIALVRAAQRKWISRSAS